ncbi:MAG: hypothetical protein Q9176_003933 [Flavoplaca citrina]
MPKRKAPRSLAEEVADLDDPAPKDFDPEQPDARNSSEESSDDENAQATEHYIDTGKGKFRQASVPNLGPEYDGSNISRGNIFNGADDSDDDPFASARSQQGASSDASDSIEYADPDTVELNENDIRQDEEIDSDEAFGEDDGEEFQHYAFRGSKSIRQAGLNQRVADSIVHVQETDKTSHGFSEMESDITETADEDDLLHGTSNGVNGATPEPQNIISKDGDADMEDASDLSSENEELRSTSPSSDTNRSPASPPADADRAALRKIMADSQKLMTSNLSKAAKSDVAKGRAIKQQRTAFDSLLNTRIRLQKSLVGINSVRAAPPNPSDSTNPAIEAAEEAAWKLWSTLDSLRRTLQSSTSTNGTIPRDSIRTDSATSIFNLWTRMQTYERQMRHQRLTTFDKWSSKTTPVSTVSHANKFSAAPTQQPLSAILEQQLTSAANMEKLVAKTRIPRSCAPLQATAALSASKSISKHDISSTPSDTEAIYDDADFYSLLLRDLLDQRSSDPQSAATSTPGVGSATIPGIKDPALRIHKQRVDTKASKGRKIRYTVQEKVQNFMAPDDRGGWGQKQREELFKGLLGMKVPRGDDESMNEDDSEEEGRAEEGLRLFRSSRW